MVQTTPQIIQVLNNAKQLLQVRCVAADGLRTRACTSLTPLFALPIGCGDSSR